MEPKSLFEWRDVVLQYVGFVSSFWILGAVGFRYGILRGKVSAEADSPSTSVLRSSAAQAAGVGLIGVALGVVSLFESLSKRAESKHVTIGDALAAGGVTSYAQVALLATLLVAFALAWRRVSIGWPIAGVAAIALALRGILSGRLGGMVNPLHVLGASLWLGTLFVLVFCGIGSLVRASLPMEQREQAVAEMVSRFSTVGLTSAALLGITGLITSWTHLNPLASLWTTPYGYALLTKLGIVAIVFGLGAWNWKRVGPALGADGGALMIRRTATTELAFAGLVLLVTSILVSLPSPKAPAAGSAHPAKVAEEE